MSSTVASTDLASNHECAMLLGDNSVDDIVVGSSGSQHSPTELPGLAHGE